MICLSLASSRVSCALIALCLLLAVYTASQAITATGHLLVVSCAAPVAGSILIVMLFMNMLNLTSYRSYVTKLSKLLLHVQSN